MVYGDARWLITSTGRAAEGEVRMADPHDHYHDDFDVAMNETRRDDVESWAKLERDMKP